MGWSAFDACTCGFLTPGVLFVVACFFASLWHLALDIVCFLFSWAQDKDGSGKIDATELRNIMLSLGENLSDEEVNQMIKEADLNGDGEIDFDEFMRMLS